MKKIKKYSTYSKISGTLKKNEVDIITAKEAERMVKKCPSTSWK